jgi:secretion/DNA translocation related TadE-like protein
VTGTRSRDDRGAATAMSLGLVGLLVLVSAICVGTVAIVLAHRRAQIAADLASLAGATALQRDGDPCAAASRTAERNDAVVTSCLVEGATVLVATSVRLPLVLGGDEVPARARAGPQTAVPGAATGTTPSAPR